MVNWNWTRIRWEGSSTKNSGKPYFWGFHCAPTFNSTETRKLIILQQQIILIIWQKYMCHNNTNISYNIASNFHCALIKECQSDLLGKSQLKNPALTRAALSCSMHGLNFVDPSFPYSAPHILGMECVAWSWSRSASTWRHLLSNSARPSRPPAQKVLN